MYENVTLCYCEHLKYFYFWEISFIFILVLCFFLQ